MIYKWDVRVEEYSKREGLWFSPTWVLISEICTTLLIAMIIILATFGHYGNYKHEQKDKYDR